MTDDYLKVLYWKTNFNTFLGYAPGTLLIIGHKVGGGFAGAPQELFLGLAEGVVRGQPHPEPAEFPEPSGCIQYHIGGRNFFGYHYKKLETQA